MLPMKVSDLCFLLVVWLFLNSTVCCPLQPRRRASVLFVSYWLCCKLMIFHVMYADYNLTPIQHCTLSSCRIFIDTVGFNATNESKLSLFLTCCLTIFKLRHLLSASASTASLCSLCSVHDYVVNSCYSMWCMQDYNLTPIQHCTVSSCRTHWG
jgi:hypothetical protein